MIDLADAEARRRIMEEHEATFIVEAAAGTGKTTALVGRIIGLIRKGAGTLNQVVAVTFTEKAAGEMKLRLRSEIEKARRLATEAERDRLDRALEELELAHIGTIHAFCGDLLHERPIEAGIDPLFRVAAEEEAEAIADAAFENWFEAILSDPPEGVRRILRRRRGRQLPREQLRVAMRALCEHRDFPQPWRREPFDRNAAIDALVNELSQLGALAAEGSRRDDYLARNLGEISRFIEAATQLEAVRARDYDGLEAQLRAAPRLRGWIWKGAPKTTFGALSRDEVLALRDQAKRNIDAFIVSTNADLAPLLHCELQAPIEDYGILKAKAGRLDFLDLLIKTRDLICRDAYVREELQRRFTHFFVDEFQDTDPLQAEILLLLAADDPRETDWRAVRPVPGKLFVVGDPKQSLYRFRRADIALYQQLKERFLATGAELLHLTTSFRAPPSIQSFVNSAFASAMAADGSQAVYVPLERARREIVGRPTVIALPVPRPYGDSGKILISRIDESFPDAVGAFIAWLVNESGWTTEEEGRAVAVRPRHIAILLRRFRNFGVDITRSYVRALEARRIPHVLVGGRSFHDREEVIALRNALTAIEWPDDELKVFATLRGPFFAIGDEALLAFRQYVDSDGELKIRRLNPMRAVDREALNHPVAFDVADALEVLRDLNVRRNYRPIAETITALLGTVRAQAGIALWPNGEQALSNCQRLIDMARHFEEGASSFRAFVENLEADAERGETNEVPIVEEGVEGVRLMTVHKAKGLEFPVVVLADPTCPATRDTPSRHVDPARRLWVEQLCSSAPIELLEAADEELRRDQAEALRVVYVAATRARDLLISPVCGDEPVEGWLSVLEPVLYPPADERHNAGQADGCPSFGEDSVLDRGPQGVPPDSGSVRPGLHRPKLDGPNVVWWDPSTLALEVEDDTGLRHRRILEVDADNTTAVESEQDYGVWKKGREDLLNQASQPSVSIQAVSALARSEASQKFVAYQPVHVEMLERVDSERASGRRFGALVHAILASVDLNGDANTIQASAASNGRLVGATDKEVSAAIVAVRATLEHPILQRAAANAWTREVRRETPVLLRFDDGSLVEGVVDLAFREETPEFSGWTVVDFKTDREFAASSDRYKAQVATYSVAIQAATGLPVRGILLIV